MPVGVRVCLLFAGSGSSSVPAEAPHPSASARRLSLYLLVGSESKADSSFWDVDASVWVESKETSQ